MTDEVAIRMADDSCLFCNIHFGPAGGHLFVGRRNSEGWIVSQARAVCIEHLATCAIQICPQCVVKHHLLPGETEN